MDTGRLLVKLISRRALRDYMAFRNVSIGNLADRVGVAKATVGHLHSGYRTTVKADTARRIEEELNAPPGSLFVPKVVHGTGTTHQSRRAA